MNFADVVVAAAPQVLDEPEERAVVADKARVALGRTGIKGAKQGRSKSGFLQKRGPLKVSRPVAELEELVPLCLG